MKDKEAMKVALTEGIFRVIGRETDGLIDYYPSVWNEAENLISSILHIIYDDEEDEEQIEELHADMDLFAKGD